MSLSTESTITGMGNIRWEDEDTGFDTVAKSVDFQKLLEQTTGETAVREGQIVKGRIVRISDDSVAVDIGHKVDGEIPVSEFRSPEGKVTIKVGDEVEVYLDCFEDNDGEMVLSRERAELLRAWDRISDAFENNEIVDGLIKPKS